MSDDRELVETAFGTGFLQHACPGDEQSAPPWILRFADKDCGEQVFIGDDAEQRAWEAWNRYAPSYNCYLFQCASIGNTRITPGSDLRDALVEAAYREAWHEGYATGDAGGSYGAVENDWLSSDARAALTKDDHGGGQTEEDRANPRLREDRAGAPSGLSPSVSSKAAHRISQGEEK